MATDIHGENSSTQPHNLSNVTQGCFFFKCNQHRKVRLFLPRVNIPPRKNLLFQDFITSTLHLQIVTPSFHYMLQLHKKSSITIIQGHESWTVEVIDQKFAAGWTEFQTTNLLNENSNILLRHIENLKFDVIQFTELKMHTYLN